VQTSAYEPLRDTGVTPWRPAPVDNPTSSDWRRKTEKENESELNATKISRSVL